MFNYKTYIMFLGVALAFSIGIQWFFASIGIPWLGLPIALAVFIIFPLVIRRRYMNRFRGYGDSGTGTGGGFFGMGPGRGSSVKYVCLVCNHRHKGGSCPRCGSKMKRADF